MTKLPKKGSRGRNPVESKTADQIETESGAWDRFERSEEETAKRRDGIASRMLNTPPKPRKPKTTGDENPRKKRRKEKG